MKLVKAEHNEQGIWYFTTKAKAARYINTSPTYLDYCLTMERPCKDWNLELIESDDIICKFIDPERKYVEN